jgi:hypothetical protein
MRNSRTYKRLEELERRAGLTTERPPIVLFFFGDSVEHRGQKWERRKDETDDALQYRVMDDLKVAGHGGKFIWLCFGDNR